MRYRSYPASQRHTLKTGFYFPPAPVHLNWFRGLPRGSLRVSRDLWQASDPPPAHRWLPYSLSPPAGLNRYLRHETEHRTSAHAPPARSFCRSVSVPVLWIPAPHHQRTSHKNHPDDKRGYNLCIPLLSPGILPSSAIIYPRRSASYQFSDIIKSTVFGKLH